MMRVAASTLAAIWLLGASAPLQARTPRRPGVSQPAPAPAVATETVPHNVTKARALFAKGASLVRSAQWAEAQAAFEESNKLRPHPITVYNIGACERALGRYTVAAATFQRALTFPAAGGATMSESLIAEARTYMAEIERLLVHVDLTVAPADAAIAIDGRPLEAVATKGERPLLVAGRRPSGRGEPLPGGRAEVLVDPGNHLFSLSRKGFNDQVIAKTFQPGKRVTLELNLDKLPAQLRVSSNEERSVVRIDQADVGLTPVDVVRPAGIYNVRVVKPGFSAYETTVNVSAGEAADISARLSRTPITQKWWFWTAATAAVAGMVVTTYYLTRSEPAAQRPPIDGGGLGWAVRIP